MRSAASTLSQYNDQIATDLSYIKFAMASAFQPIIEKLISLVYKLLSYVNYLAKAWFGINLFGKATVKNFNKTNDSAKKLKKTLSTLNFDELNILQDNSDTGNNEIKTPSMDLSGIEEVEPPKWLEIVKNVGEWIIDHWELVALGIIGIFIAFKKFSRSNVGTSFTGFFDGLGKAAGAIAILGGLALVIKSICKLIETFSESGMSLKEVAGLLGIVLGEVALAFIILLGAMSRLEPSWQSITGAVVIFAGLALVLESVSRLIDTFSKSGMSLNEVIGLMATVLITIVALMGSVAALGPAMHAGLVPFLAVIGGISAVLIVMAATLPTILDAIGKFTETVGPVFVSIIEAVDKLITHLIDSLGRNLPPIIDSLFKNVLNFINKLGPAIDNFVTHCIKAVTKLINFVVSGIEYLVNRLVVDGVNTIIKGINSIGKYVGFTIPTMSEFKIARFNPTYMATGGIIDVPKRGVPLASNVVGGEAGAEGVLPLTDEDTMRRLGQEIGKWIIINLQLNNYIDGRLLCKIIKKIMNGQEFSTNGG